MDMAGICTSGWNYKLWEAAVTDGMGLNGEGIGQAASHLIGRQVRRAKQMMKALPDQ